MPRLVCSATSRSSSFNTKDIVKLPCTRIFVLKVKQYCVGKLRQKSTDQCKRIKMLLLKRWTPVRFSPVSNQNTIKNGIHSFPAWRSMIKGRVKASTVCGRQVVAWLESQKILFLSSFLGKLVNKGGIKLPKDRIAMHLALKSKPINMEKQNGEKRIIKIRRKEYVEKLLVLRTSSKIVVAWGEIDERLLSTSDHWVRRKIVWSKFYKHFGNSRLFVNHSYVTTNVNFKRANYLSSHKNILWPQT